jgi:hypothetical protein
LLGYLNLAQSDKQVGLDKVRGSTAARILGVTGHEAFGELAAAAFV